MIIPHLPTTLLSSVKKSPKLELRRRWCLAAGSTTAPVDAASAVYRHHPALLLLTMILPLPQSLLSSIEKLPKLVPRRRWRLATGSTADYAPVDAAAAVQRHRPPLLVLTMILPLPSLLLSSIEKLPKLVPRHGWRLAAGSTATPVDAVAAVHRHRLLLLVLMMIIPPLPAPLLYPSSCM